jgi:hypothetical protein
MGALCRMKQAGFARHIGISNFTVPLIKEAVRLATEPLVTNQIEWHPFIDQSKVVAACRRHGLSVTAYSPIARGRAGDDARLRLIGMHHGKTALQAGALEGEHDDLRFRTRSSRGGGDSWARRSGRTRRRLVGRPKLGLRPLSGISNQTSGIRRVLFLIRDY